MITNSLRHLESHLGPTIKNEGKDCLYFGGTAYLGIPQSDDFLDLYVEGLRLYGINNGTSRGNNVQLAIYDQAEVCAAKRFRSEAALITSSGYLAAQLAIRKFLSFGEVRYAPDTHPALWVNEIAELKISFDDWALHIVKEINESNKESWLLITNSMSNLYPEQYDFSFLKKLNKKVIIVVDDSHGIGVNNNGLGVLPDIPKCNNIEIVVVASMAKALGVDAGIILSTHKIITLLKKSNEFLGASPPTAAGLYAFMNAEKIYRKAIDKLKINMNLMSEALIGNKKWHFIKGFPVYLAKNAELSNELKLKGILISSFPYPDRDGPVINRIVLSSWHSIKDVEELISALN